MRTVEDQLSSARADVQRSVAQMPTRAAHTIRRRQQYRKTTALIASGAVVVAVIVGTSLVSPGESQDMAGTPPADSPPATSGLTPEQDQAIEDALVGDDSDGIVTEDDPADADEPTQPTAEDWVELPGGLSVAAIAEDNGHMRIWTKSAAQEPTPAASTDVAFLPVPVNATQIAVLIPSSEFLEAQGIDITPYEKFDEARIHWFEGSDAVDTVSVDWSGDPRFGVALVEARDANILDVEFVTD